MTFSLPKVSDALSSLTLPVSGKNITMRPMIVRDIKALAIAAMKKDDPIGLYKTAISILNNSISEDIKMEKLPSADLELAFLKLKSISSGDSETYNFECPKCKTANQIEINFDTDPVVDVKDYEVDSRVILKSVNGGEVGVNMKPFTYEALLKSTGNKKMEEIDQQFEVIKGCVASIFEGEEILLRENIPDKSFDEWFNTLNVKQLQEISKYMETIPSVAINIDKECEKCGESIKETIKGLSDFLV